MTCEAPGRREPDQIAGRCCSTAAAGRTAATAGRRAGCRWRAHARARRCRSSAHTTRHRTALCRPPSGDRGRGAPRPASHGGCAPYTAHLGPTLPPPHARPASSVRRQPRSNRMVPVRAARPAAPNAAPSDPAAAAAAAWTQP
eukprot:364329-Chlamydomonas_euryale.AAC.10